MLLHKFMFRILYYVLSRVYYMYVSYDKNYVVVSKNYFGNTLKMLGVYSYSMYLKSFMHMMIY